MSSKNRAPQAAAGATLSPRLEAGSPLVEAPAGGGPMFEGWVFCSRVSGQCPVVAPPLPLGLGPSSLQSELDFLVAFARWFPSAPPSDPAVIAAVDRCPLLLAPSSAFAPALPPPRQAPGQSRGRINSQSSSCRPPSVHLSGPSQESGIDQTCWY